MLVSRLAATSAAVAATSKRTEKRSLLAATITDLVPGEIEAGIGFLVGAPRQGRVGIGWATLQRAITTAADEPSITIRDLDQLIDQVAATSGAGSSQARVDQIIALLERATADEVPFIRHVLIGDLRQGALAGVVTDAVAAAAGVKAPLLRRAVMLCGDLGVGARVALTEGTPGLERIDLVVGRPIQPMLASTASDPATAVADLGESLIEWKLDGARIQVHRSGDDIRIFTRNLNDVTSRLPEVVAIVRRFDCESVVLDGEVLGLAHDEGPGAFQDTMSRFGSATETSPTAGSDDVAASTLRPYFFDLLFRDGDSLLDQPLRSRHDQLRAVVGDHHIPAIITADPDAAAAHLDAALAARHEGVMIKGIDSTYDAGRRGKAWRKIKPVHTLDLIVIGAEWGHGRRRGWLSNLHLGALGDDGQPVMVGKTFKGLTDELLAWQTAALLERETRRSDSGLTVYVRPGLVIEIAVDGAQASTRYPGGVALRFARVKRYRPDRDPDTADTIHAVRALLPVH